MSTVMKQYGDKSRGKSEHFHAGWKIGQDIRRYALAQQEVKQCKSVAMSDHWTSKTMKLNAALADQRMTNTSPRWIRLLNKANNKEKTMLMPSEIKQEYKDKGWSEAENTHATHVIVANHGWDGESIFWNGNKTHYVAPHTIDSANGWMSKYFRPGSCNSHKLTVFFVKKNDKKVKLEERAAAMRKELDKLDAEIGQA